MKSQPLDYEVPPALLEPRGWPAWRDLLYTWPGCFVGCAAGIAMSLLYFAPNGWVWTPLFIAGFKGIVGVSLTASDRWRWFGFGLLFSIAVGVFLWFSAFLGQGWCC